MLHFYIFRKKSMILKVHSLLLKRHKIVFSIQLFFIMCEGNSSISCLFVWFPGSTWCYVHHEAFWRGLIEKLSPDRWRTINMTDLSRRLRPRGITFIPRPGSITWVSQSVGEELKVQRKNKQPEKTSSAARLLHSEQVFVLFSAWLTVCVFM